MNAQLSLFNPRSRIARVRDPASSHLAAAKITRTGTRQSHCALIHNYLSVNPGKTSAEIAAAVGLDRVEAARRLPDLEKAGNAVKGEMRVCTVCFSKCVTWWP